MQTAPLGFGDPQQLTEQRIPHDLLTAPDLRDELVVGFGHHTAAIRLAVLPWSRHARTELADLLGEPRTRRNPDHNPMIHDRTPVHHYTTE